MSLQGAVAGQLPGKKVVYGIVDVTTNVAVDLSAHLETIDVAVVSYGEVPAATNENVYGTISGTTLTITCTEADFTAGTAEKAIHYIAVGDAPK